MATTSYQLSTSTWTAISTAGQSGVCWLRTGGMCAIDHSTSGSGGCLVTDAYMLAGQNNGSNSVSLNADTTADIFYALAISTSNPDPVVIVSDVV